MRWFTANPVRWFTANPVLTGCLLPVLMYPIVFLVGVALSQAAFRLGGPFLVGGGILRFVLMTLPLVLALVVWARWFGRRN